MDDDVKTSATHLNNETRYPDTEFNARGLTSD